MKHSAAVKRGIYTPDPKLREKLERYRLEYSVTYRSLAALIGGVSDATLIEFINDGRAVRKTTAFKIESFLKKVSRAA